MSAPPNAGAPSGLSRADEQLLTLFDTLQTTQLERMDKHAERIIELITGMLALLLALVAFGKDFPPDYLTSWPARLCVVGTLMLYMLALASALFALRLRTYRRYSNNLTLLRQELDKMRRDKRPWVELAGILFLLGTSLPGSADRRAGVVHAD